MTARRPPSIFPLPPRTQELFTKLSVAHYGENKTERAGRVEFALLELCATLERELEKTKAAK